MTSHCVPAGDATQRWPAVDFLADQRAAEPRLRDMQIMWPASSRTADWPAIRELQELVHRAIRYVRICA